MPSITLYKRSDTHVINGLSAYQLKTTNSSSSANISVQKMGGMYGATCDVSVYTRTSGGSETTLGSNVASVTQTLGTSSLLSNTWECPETSLSTTDAIKIVVRLTMQDQTNTATFISEQLGATKLLNENWTFYYYINSSGAPVPPYSYNSISYFYWGNSSYESKITGLSYSQYTDRGIRIRIAGETIKLGTKDLESNDKLRIRIGTTTYGIPLIDTGDSSDSGIRIYDGTSIKTVPKVD